MSSLDSFPELKLVKEHPISYSSDEFLNVEPEKKTKIEENKPF